MSRKAAINSFCRACIYDRKSEGSSLQQIKACTSDDCALYPFRPGATRRSSGPSKSTSPGVRSGGNGLGGT